MHDDHDEDDGDGLDDHEDDGDGPAVAISRILKYAQR